jgi:futalosine hydrolase
MAFNLLITAATPTEASALQHLHGVIAGDELSPAGISLDVVVTGIGMVPTAWSLMNYFMQHGRPDLIINTGIGGTFGDTPAVGDVVIIERECFADMGIDDRGRFVPLWETGLVDGDRFPFAGDGWMVCNNTYLNRLSDSFMFCRGVTSDTVSGSSERVERLRKYYNPSIETMEGASFFYICSREGVPFIAVRGISNRVEERDRKSWMIAEALQNLGEKTEGIIRLLFSK